MATSAFAMESVSELAADMADRQDHDIRLEAAAAKEWNTVRAWRVIDDALEIRGGRGYETERSLAARGEVPIGIERMMRDSRINRIFEGSSEIMHLFMAREAVDKHLAIAGRARRPERRASREKISARLRAVALLRGSGTRACGCSGVDGRASGRSEGSRAHVRFIERASRKLARSIFHGMLVHRAGPRATAGVPLPDRRHRDGPLRDDGRARPCAADARARCAPPRLRGGEPGGPVLPERLAARLGSASARSGSTTTHVRYEAGLAVLRGPRVARIRHRGSAP